MTFAVCVDDRGGMLFNNRRQSRDRAVVADLLALAEGEGKRLCVSGFSQKLFEGIEGVEPLVKVLDRFPEDAGEGDICFAENISLAPWEDRAERLVIYRWNRAYPGDLFFDIRTEAPWRLVSVEEFEGYSHEKITKEIYVK